MEGRPEEGQSGKPDELGILTRNEAHRPLNILLKSFLKKIVAAHLTFLQSDRI